MSARTATTLCLKTMFFETALSNGVEVGDLSRKFDGATVVERAAAYAVRVKGHVIAPESSKVRNIPRLA